MMPDRIAILIDNAHFQKRYAGGFGFVAKRGARAIFRNP